MKCEHTIIAFGNMSVRFVQGCMSAGLMLKIAAAIDHQSPEEIERLVLEAGFT